MPGNCCVARPSAQPMRWVKESFLPAAASCALRARRCESSTLAATSRNDVAVGTTSESVMFWTNRAAGPVIGVRPGCEVGAGEGGGGDAGDADDVVAGAAVGAVSRFPLPVSPRPPEPYVGLI